MDPLRRLGAAERFARARELRHTPTPAERHAWTLLRNRGILGLKFRR
jgi:very-short-patch-repair endonuclease